MQKPHFIIVGAQKCGTDSLYGYLVAHPEVAMAHPKEPHFFSREPMCVDWHWYQDCFPDLPNAKVCGEASASYLAVEGVARRMYERLGGDIKLICIVRNPVDRIYSAFLHMRKSRPFFDTRPFEEAVAWQGDSVDELVAEERRRIERARRDGTIDIQHFADFGAAADWNYRYITNSVYRPLISDFLHYFPKQNCLFLLLDDLRIDWRRAARTVFTHVGVDPDFADQLETGERNTTKMPRDNLLGRVLSYRWGRSMARWTLAPQYLDRLKKRLSRMATTRALQMPSEVQRHLLQVFTAENAVLSRLLGIDLSKWNTTG